MTPNALPTDALTNRGTDSIRRIAEFMAEHGKRSVVLSTEEVRHLVARGDTYRTAARAIVAAADELKVINLNDDDAYAAWSAKNCEAFRLIREAVAADTI